MRIFLISIAFRPPLLCCSRGYVVIKEGLFVFVLYATLMLKPPIPQCLRSYLYAAIKPLTEWKPLYKITSLLPGQEALAKQPFYRILQHTTHRGDENTLYNLSSQRRKSLSISSSTRQLFFSLFCYDNKSLLPPVRERSVRVVKAWIMSDAKPPANASTAAIRRPRYWCLKLRFVRVVGSCGTKEGVE